MPSSLRPHVQATLDVSASNLNSVGDLAFERTAGRIWISDGSTGGLAIGVAGAIPASGGFRIYQVWYRNAAAFCTASTFNLSNSIVVEWFP